MFLDFAGTLVNLDHVAQVEPYTPGGGKQLVVILSNGNRVGVKDGPEAVEIMHAIEYEVETRRAEAIAERAATAYAAAHKPQPPLIHHSIIPFVAVCGADKCGQETASDLAKVTCSHCRAKATPPKPTKKGKK